MAAIWQPLAQTTFEMTLFMALGDVLQQTAEHCWPREMAVFRRGVSRPRKATDPPVPLSQRGWQVLRFAAGGLMFGPFAGLWSWLTNRYATLCWGPTDPARPRGQRKRVKGLFLTLFLEYLLLGTSLTERFQGRLLRGLPPLGRDLPPGVRECCKKEEMTQSVCCVSVCARAGFALCLWVGVFAVCVETRPKACPQHYWVLGNVMGNGEEC